MSNGDLANATWFKSSYSNGQGECVEVAITGDHVAMRDSKDPDGPALVFTAAAWSTFVGGAANGELVRM
ncbi:DUF397 domain-containing protein [Streptomyces polygonati]|uniref:DUF397 domain-containing protein n=1 Tax=Streptomyces polygonati TaxID=1617087 RepID=A0ABV8HJF7_9ACTN